MYKNILIATDGSELADKAVSNGLSLARELNTNVVIVTVTELWSAFEMARRLDEDRQAIEHYEENAAKWAQHILSATADKAKELNVSYETLHIKDRHPAEGIIETSKSKGSDLIVMASHGRRGIKKAILGSVANEVTTYSAIPVLIYK